MARMQKHIDSKRAVSPLVATVLLIAITVSLAATIFVWQSGFFAEQVQKFYEGQNILAERSCEKIIFDWSFDPDSSELIIDNQGNVPISKSNIKIIDAKGNEESSVLDTPIKSSETYNASIANLPPVQGDDVEVTPYITGIGVKSGTAKLYYCQNSGVRKTIP
jgi:flagellin-like protein